MWARTYIYDMYRINKSWAKNVCKLVQTVIYFIPLFIKMWIQAAAVTVLTTTTPAAASVTWDGKAQIALCPPALMSATTMVGVWTGNVCVIRATQEKTATSWCVLTIAMIRGSAWMENVYASLTSPVRAVASRSVPMTVPTMGIVWMASASAMKAFMGKTVHQVSYSNSKHKLCRLFIAALTYF